MIKLWLSSVMIHMYTSHRVMRLGEKIYRKDVQKIYSLYDMVHSRFNIPSIPFFRPLLEIGHIIPFLHLITVGKRESINLWLLRHSVLLLCRALCFSSTLLPLPDISYSSKPLWFIFGGKHDLLFSGHASFMWLSTFMLGEMGIRTELSILYTILSLLVSFGIIISRNHYTIDVIVAIMAAVATMHVKID